MNSEPNSWVGVDLNTTGHIAVVAHPSTGKVFKLGKKAHHIHLKYNKIRRQLQTHGKSRKLKRINKRERSILKDLNHQISREIVDVAKWLGSGIKLEKLYGSNPRIRKKNFSSHPFCINNESFYQLQKMVEVKAKKVGIPVVYVDPAFTSKRCSKCGDIGLRHRKSFECPCCGHVDHADVNAAFNIAVTDGGGDQLHVDRDACKGSTDTPPEVVRERRRPASPLPFLAGGMSESYLFEHLMCMLE
ncbi:MAG: transposase [Methanomicrobiaceae archaeon]|nr:transposase [Methanomicrobiaceae archaeon]